MKKVLICGLLAASFGMTVQAGSVGQGFDVKASINATCVADNAATPAVNFGPIAAFDSTAIPDATADIKFKCTKGLSPTASLSALSGTVAGLAYTLAVDTGTNGGGTGATGVAWTFKVTGSMAAGQGGDTGAATTDSQTLTISF